MLKRGAIGLVQEKLRANNVLEVHWNGNVSNMLIHTYYMQARQSPVFLTRSYSHHSFESKNCFPVNFRMH